MAVLLTREQRRRLAPLLVAACRAHGYDDALPQPPERFRQVSFWMIRPAEGRCTLEGS